MNPTTFVNENTGDTRQIGPGQVIPPDYKPIGYIGTAQQWHDENTLPFTSLQPDETGVIAANENTGTVTTENPITAADFKPAGQSVLGTLTIAGIIYLVLTA